jgi:hypothetical protein
MNRSSTVGMPSIRTPLPSGLRITTRRTGCGAYVPLSSGDEVLSSHDQLDERQSLGSAGILACRARLTHSIPTSRPSVASFRGP